MNIIDQASWINSSAEEPREPTFRAAGILFLGALCCVVRRRWRRFFRPKPTIKAAGGPYDLGHMLPMLRPVYTPIRNTVPRVPGHGTALPFKQILHIVPEPESE